MNQLKPLIKRVAFALNDATQPVNAGDRNLLLRLLPILNRLPYEEDTDFPAPIVKGYIHHSGAMLETLGPGDYVTRKDYENVVGQFQELAAVAYQLAGVMNAPVRFLNAFSDATSGELQMRNRTSTLLPVIESEVGTFPVSNV